ncbi:MAG: hypothetical protein V3S64_16940 [bacterium]
MNNDQLGKLIGRDVEIVPLPVEAAYPRNILHWEVAKAALGITSCLAIIIGLQPSPWLAWPIGGVALVFGYYLWQQAGRYALRIRVDETGASVMRGGRRLEFPWERLKDFRLEFYPNGRKAQSGSLVVKLYRDTERLRVDSTLDHFPTLLTYAARAARTAQEKGLALHPTTVDNLKKLGL